MLCCVSETKGQDQPEDENFAKARPKLKQGEERGVTNLSIYLILYMNEWSQPNQREIYYVYGGYCC